MGCLEGHATVCLAGAKDTANDWGRAVPSRLRRVNTSEGEHDSLGGGERAVWPALKAARARGTVDRQVALIGQPVVVQGSLRGWGRSLPAEEGSDGERHLGK